MPHAPVFTGRAVNCTWAIIAPNMCNGTYIFNERQLAAPDNDVVQHIIIVICTQEATQADIAKSNYDNK